VLGIILGPAAIVSGWLGIGRTWAGARPIPALVAVVLGAIDTLLAFIWLAGTAAPGNGLCEAPRKGRGAVTYAAPPRGRDQPRRTRSGRIGPAR